MSSRANFGVKFTRQLPVVLVESSHIDIRFRLLLQFNSESVSKVNFWHIVWAEWREHERVVLNLLLIMWLTREISALNRKSRYFVGSSAMKYGKNLLKGWKFHCISLHFQAKSILNFFFRVLVHMGCRSFSVILPCPHAHCPILVQRPRPSVRSFAFAENLLNYKRLKKSIKTLIKRAPVPVTTPVQAAKAKAEGKQNGDKRAATCCYRAKHCLLSGHVACFC